MTDYRQPCGDSLQEHVAALTWCPTSRNSRKNCEQLQPGLDASATFHLEITHLGCENNLLTSRPAALGESEQDSQSWR